MTIGENLKRARKKLNLSLDEAAQRTKIAKMFLIALEKDDISRLPQGVYTRNFLRAYARFLRLDEDIITADYHEQYSVKPHFVTQQEQTKLDDFEFRKARRKLSIFVVVLVILLLGAAYYFLRVQPPGSLQETMEWLWNRLQGTTSQTTEPLANDQAFSANAAQKLALPDEVAPVAAETIRDGLLETVGDENEGDKTSAKVELSSAETPEEERPDPGSYAARLPSFELASLIWTPEDRRAERIENMFALESIQPVWIEVIIDGEILTKRLLSTGQVRCYRYGSNNTVIIGDASRVAVQDGTAFKKVASAIQWTLAVRDFGPGDFFEVLDRKIRERQGLED